MSYVMTTESALLDHCFMKMNYLRILRGLRTSMSVLCKVDKGRLGELDCASYLEYGYIPSPSNPSYLFVIIDSRTTRRGRASIPIAATAATRLTRDLNITSRDLCSQMNVFSDLSPTQSSSSLSHRLRACLLQVFSSLQHSCPPLSRIAKSKMARSSAVRFMHVRYDTELSRLPQTL
ncbi:hypothetical protein BV25DRAFT_960359 [Artomyces pyxidatus]|uniref:Uncharacterized protein n=1 Tax=Artomyces pyxidatus TaxID=48021 RepID=A0ACB8SVY0_9AGAM|nr:hypothetical protein BV25DRAFT_960359 [Artomyces pyxidatus]